MTRIALDVHAHLLPVLPERLAGFAEVSWDAAAKTLSIDGHGVGIARLFQPAALAGWMAEQGVAHAWISAPPPAYRMHLRGAGALEWSRYLNEGLDRAAADHEGAMTPLYHLPTQDPESACRIADERGGKGHRLFAMPSGTGDARTLADAEFDGLWSRLDALGALVFVHPGECADGRLSAHYLTNLLGNPHETGVAISHLVLGGVLERHPQLELCFAHGGGTYPMIAARIQRGQDTARPGVDTAAARPSDLVRRLHVDCICHSQEALCLSEAVFGEDRLVFGSDWPFPMGLVEPDEQLAKLDPDRRERITRINPKRLLASRQKGSAS